MIECTFPGCDRPVGYPTLGLCATHAVQWYRTRTLKPIQVYEPTCCAVPWCLERARVKGYCHAHYKRLLRGADLDHPIREYKRRATNGA